MDEVSSDLHAFTTNPLHHVDSPAPLKDFTRQDLEADAISSHLEGQITTNSHCMPPLQLHDLLFSRLPKEDTFMCTQGRQDLGELEEVALLHLQIFVKQIAI